MSAEFHVTHVDDVTWGKINTKRFTLDLLESIKLWLDRVEQTDVKFVVLSSLDENVFSYGGDLPYFINCIKSGDRDGLLNYAYKCTYLGRRFSSFQDKISISLIRGQCFGGGFEAALYANHVIAERGSVLGFPELRFNMFPGMGAISHLVRSGISRNQIMKYLDEFGLRTAEIWSNETGLIHEIAPDGRGVERVDSYIDNTRKRFNGVKAIQRAVEHAAGPTDHELMVIADIWVNCAMNITDRDIRLMEKIIERQGGK